MAHTAADAHKWLQRTARELSRAKEIGNKKYIRRFQDRYDTAYRLYTNPFNVPKHAPAITPTN